MNAGFARVARGPGRGLRAAPWCWLAAVVAVLVAAAAAPATPAPVEASFFATASQDHAGALAALRTSAARTTDPRVAAFARAAALLGADMGSPSAVDAVRTALAEVLAGNQDDELGQAALYYQARLLDAYQQPADRNGAIVLLTRLAERHPESWFGQYALVRLAVWDLYAAPDNATETKVRLQRWRERLDAVSDAALRRCTCWILGDANIRLAHDLDAALACYQESTQLDFSRFDIRSLMLLRVCNLAAELGRRDLALAAARRHLAEFPRSLYTLLLRQRVAALQAGAPLVECGAP